MKKILFNDKFALTQAVLDGRKTQTRRLVPQSTIDKYSLMEDFTIIDDARYNVGEVVAVAQSYKDAGVHFLPEEDDEFGCYNFPAEQTNGWTNKMFVKAALMPYRIRITDVRVERLNDIDELDCQSEGIDYVNGYSENYFFGFGVKTDKGWIRLGNTPREAYAALIDRISGRGTFESNPYVFAYTFELVK